jgi:hypothetical protein
MEQRYCQGGREWKGKEVKGLKGKERKRSEVIWKERRVMCRKEERKLGKGLTYGGFSRLKVNPQQSSGSHSE